MCFRKNGRAIAPKTCSASIWCRHQGGSGGKFFANIVTLGIAHVVAQYDVVGYISVLVRTGQKNHIVCLGFALGRNRDSKCGVVIRGEDGILDGIGSIAGYGTTPTGRVTDIEELACSVSFSKTKKIKDIDWHEFNEECRTLKIKCEFNNEDHGKVVFTFHDGVRIPE